MIFTHVSLVQEGEAVRQAGLRSARDGGSTPKVCRTRPEVLAGRPGHVSP